MAKKRSRKHRRVNLGSPAPDHLKKWQSAITSAENSYEHARGSDKCKSALQFLAEGMMRLAAADAHLQSALQSGKLGRQTTRWTNATGALRRKLAKAFSGALDRCARTYPET